jgi:hypothetical protein
MFPNLKPIPPRTPEPRHPLGWRKGEPFKIYVDSQCKTPRTPSAQEMFSYLKKKTGVEKSDYWDEIEGWDTEGLRSDYYIQVAESTPPAKSKRGSPLRKSERKKKSNGGQKRRRSKGR